MFNIGRTGKASDQSVNTEHGIFDKGYRMVRVSLVRHLGHTCAYEYVYFQDTRVTPIVRTRYSFRFDSFRFVELLELPAIL